MLSQFEANELNSFGAISSQVSGRPVLGRFLDRFLGHFGHFLSRWEKIKVLEPIGKLEGCVWVRFLAWRKKKMISTMIFLKNRPRGAFLVAYTTLNGHNS